MWATGCCTIGCCATIPDPKKVLDMLCIAGGVPCMPRAGICTCGCGCCPICCSAPGCMATAEFHCANGIGAGRCADCTRMPPGGGWFMAPRASLHSARGHTAHDEGPFAPFIPPRDGAPHIPKRVMRRAIIVPSLSLSFSLSLYSPCLPFIPSINPFSTRSFHISTIRSQCTLGPPCRHINHTSSIHVPLPISSTSYTPFLPIISSYSLMVLFSSSRSFSFLSFHYSNTANIVSWCTGSWLHVVASRDT